MRRRAPARRAVRPRASRRGAISALSAVSLTAIVAVLVLVSLPRLRGFVCIENEAEARDTARALARALARVEERGLPEPSELSMRELVSATEGLRFSGEPAYLDGARVLRMHGYLFSILPCAPTLALPAEREEGAVLAGEPAAATGSPAASGGYVVRAWPWRCGRTGRRAFLAFPGGELLRSTEAVAVPEGPSAPREPVADLRGWRRRP